MEQIINIALYATLFYLLYKLLIKFGDNKLNKIYIECIKQIDNQEKFEENYQKLINHPKITIEFKTKAKIIKLYRAIREGNISDYYLLDEIELGLLMKVNNKYEYNIIKINEDSFFYYAY